MPANPDITYVVLRNPALSPGDIYDAFGPFTDKGTAEDFGFKKWGDWRAEFTWEWRVVAVRNVLTRTNVSG